MDETIFKTVLRNERKTKGVVIWGRYGEGQGILGPGRALTLETWTKDALYAPWSEVIFRDDGIVTVPNPEYPQPKSRWTLTVLNKAGGELERRIIAHREVVLPKGLARTFEIDPEDPMAIYSRMEIRRVMERSDEENLEFPSYSRFRPVVKDKFFGRSAEELQELEKTLKALSEVEHG